MCLQLGLYLVYTIIRKYFLLLFCYHYFSCELLLHVQSVRDAVAAQLLKWQKCVRYII